MSIDTIIRVADIENVIGIKDCFGDISSTTEMIRRCRTELKKNFSIMTGEDTNIFTNLCLGGNGAIAAIGHIVGRKIKEMMNKYKTGDIQGAREIQYNIFALQRLMVTAPNPSPIKASLDLLGLEIGGDVRLPLVGVCEEVKGLLRTELEKLYT